MIILSLQKLLNDDHGGLFGAETGTKSVAKNGAHFESRTSETGNEIN